MLIQGLSHRRIVATRLKAVCQESIDNTLLTLLRAGAFGPESGTAPRAFSQNLEDYVVRQTIFGLGPHPNLDRAPRIRRRAPKIVQLHYCSLGKLTTLSSSLIFVIQGQLRGECPKATPKD
jgi:hypothetical protein